MSEKLQLSDMNDFTYLTQAVCQWTMVSTKVVKILRSYFSIHKNIREAVFKKSFNNGYFEGLELSEAHIDSLRNGDAPSCVRNNVSEPMFNIHHKVPLKFGGTNHVENFVILPKHFHDLIHKIINAQTQNLCPGDVVFIKGMPDFQKLTMETMSDDSFVEKYQQYVEKVLGISLDRSKKVVKKPFDKHKYMNNGRGVQTAHVARPSVSLTKAPTMIMSRALSSRTAVPLSKGLNRCREN